MTPPLFGKSSATRFAAVSLPLDDCIVLIHRSRYGILAGAVGNIRLEKQPLVSYWIKAAKRLRAILFQ